MSDYAAEYNKREALAADRAARIAADKAREALAADRVAITMPNFAAYCATLSPAAALRLYSRLIARVCATCGGSYDIVTARAIGCGLLLDCATVAAVAHRTARIDDRILPGIHFGYSEPASPHYFA